MRTHTTYTDTRRIMRLSGAGLSAQEISECVFIDPGHIQKIIDLKSKKKRTRKPNVEKNVQPSEVKSEVNNEG